MLYYAMLCCAMLCYAMLCCAVLCCAMLCYAMLCYAMLCYANNAPSKKKLHAIVSAIKAYTKGVLSIFATLLSRGIDG